jgi:hypothetical protein
LLILNKDTDFLSKFIFLTSYFTFGDSIPLTLPRCCNVKVNNERAAGEKRIAIVWANN